MSKRKQRGRKQEHEGRKLVAHLTYCATTLNHHELLSDFDLSVIRGELVKLRERQDAARAKAPPARGKLD